MSERNRPLEGQPVFFTDRCLGCGIVPNALRDAGFRVETHDDHFPQSEEDTEWLPEVGRRGWAVLTEDKRIKTRILEVAAMLDADTHVFILRPVRRLTNPMKAEAFIIGRAQMEALTRNRPTPLLATVTPSGSVNEILGYSGLQTLLEALGG